MKRGPRLSAVVVVVGAAVAEEGTAGGAVAMVAVEVDVAARAEGADAAVEAVAVGIAATGETAGKNSFVWRSALGYFLAQGVLGYFLARRALGFVLGCGVLGYLGAA